MSTTADINADREEIYRAVRERRCPDPAVTNGVRERAEKIRQEIFQKHGLLDIAVDLIREARDA